jgi:hypothetical protein
MANLLYLQQNDSVQADKPLILTQLSGAITKAQGQFNRNKSNFA